MTSPSKPARMLARIESTPSAGNALARAVGLLFYEQPFFDRFSVLTLVFISFNPVFWGNDLLSFVDLAQSLAIICIDQAELEFRHARELVPRFLNLRGVQPGNLDQNPITPDRADDRFASAKVIHAFANDFHCLVKHAFRDRRVAMHKPNQEGGAALNIETECDLFLRWPHRSDADDHHPPH